MSVTGVKTTMALKDHMRTIARHVGEWRGTYTRIDAEGRLLDRHASHLVCVEPSSGPFALHQVNHYTWDDGRSQSVEFVGILRGDKLHFDNDRIVGYLWETDPQTVILRWSYKTDPTGYLYELIQMSRDFSHKFRTWHWMNDDRLVKRTLIEETRVS